MADEKPELNAESAENEIDLSPEQETQPPAPSEDYQELQNRYLRLAADFENYRKRQAQEREFLFKYGAQSTLETLLPILDNLERAQQSLSESSDPKMLYKSFELLSQQLLEALKNVGLEKMSPLGEPFDPEKHEALSQQEKADVPEHSILEVYQNGYTLYDKVLRPAKVVVSSQPLGESVQDDSLLKASSGQNPFHKTSSSESSE